MRYINWNIKCRSNIEKIISLIKQNVGEDNNIIALQEVMPDAADILKEVFSKDYKILYSLDLREPGKFDTDNRRLGVMLLVSDDYEVCEWDVMDRAIFPERTLDAIISDKDNKAYEILVLHSLTGVSFKMAKSAQFRTFAEYVNVYKPDIASFDANEPKIDHYDIEKMEFFDQGQGEEGKGARFFFDELRNNKLRDVYVDNYNRAEFIEGQPLVTSHKISGTGTNRRYDFVFMREDLKVRSVKYLYEEAIEATSDHAMIVVDYYE